MNRYQYKITIYDIQNEHYATIMCFSFKEPADMYREYHNEIECGNFGIYANRCSVTRIASEFIPDAVIHPEPDYPEFLLEQAS